MALAEATWGLLMPLSCRADVAVAWCAAQLPLEYIPCRRYLLDHKVVRVHTYGDGAGAKRAAADWFYRGLPGGDQL
ncbi:MAG: hypothetical protein C4297_03090 [Gemmataceae bacterium]